MTTLEADGENIRENTICQADIDKVKVGIIVEHDRGGRIRSEGR
jgi:hypothetical protein